MVKVIFPIYFKAYLSDVPNAMHRRNFLYVGDFGDACNDLFGEHLPRDHRGFWFKNLSKTRGIVVFLSIREKEELYTTFPFTQAMVNIPGALSARLYDLFDKPGHPTITQKEFSKVVDSYFFGGAKKPSDDFTIGWSR
jgi:hypothetical protein